MAIFKFANCNKLPEGICGWVKIPMISHIIAICHLFWACCWASQAGAMPPQRWQERRWDRPRIRASLSSLNFCIFEISFDGRFPLISDFLRYFLFNDFHWFHDFSYVLPMFFPLFSIVFSQMFPSFQGQKLDLSDRGSSVARWEATRPISQRWDQCFDESLGFHRHMCIYMLHMYIYIYTHIYIHNIYIQYIYICTQYIYIHTIYIYI